MLAFVLVGASHLPPAHTRRASLQPRSVHRLRGGLRADSTEAADVHLGLRNQGNTCYMNSLLQVLYHVPEFRRAIYSLPTSTAAVRSATAAPQAAPAPR
jgi:ubiquitin C-terminal hydrolase